MVVLENLTIHGVANIIIRRINSICETKKEAVNMEKDEKYVKLLRYDKYKKLEINHRILIAYFKLPFQEVETINKPKSVNGSLSKGYERFRGILPINIFNKGGLMWN